MTLEEKAEEYRKSLKQRLIDNDEFERLEKFDENVEEAYLAGLKEQIPQWHDLRKSSTDYPEPKKLVRVHCYNGDEYICETYLYEPSEDEIGYGKMIIQFIELNGDWVDDNCIQAWCEIEPFGEGEKE